MRKQKIVILMLLLVLAYLVAPSRGKDTRTNTTERKEKKLLTKIEIKKEQVSTSSRSSKSRNNVRETETTATVIENWMVGYVTDNVNIRKEPNTNSEIYGLFEFNTCVTYAQYNNENEWVKVRFNDNIAYISSLYLTDTSCISTEYNVPDNNGFKSYMPYDAITNRESLQYKLQHEYAYSGNYGIRQVNGRYCVAIGTAFGTQIGDYIDLVLENGEVIKAIVSDIKADKDTDYRNIVTMHNGCVSEFIVDISVLMHEINLHGDVSVAAANWNSKVCKIRVYEKNIFTN